MGDVGIRPPTSFPSQAEGKAFLWMAEVVKLNASQELSPSATRF